MKLLELISGIRALEPKVRFISWCQLKSSNCSSFDSYIRWTL